MKISHTLFIIFLMIILFAPFTGCDKNKEITKSPFPPIVMENPLQEYAFTNNFLKNNFVLQTNQPDLSTEIGMRFSASKNGILWSIGFKMPEKGKYFISLWEVATKQLILTDSVSYTDTSKFMYKALLSLNTAVIIDKNKDYMAGIFYQSGHRKARFLIMFYLTLVFSHSHSPRDILPLKQTLL